MKKVNTVGTGVEASAGARVQALSASYEGRGLAFAVARDARVQEAAEEATAALDPVAYRKSMLTDEAVTRMYRGGKEVMDGKDLLDYFGEARKMRLETSDLSESVSIYDVADPSREEEYVPNTALVLAEERKKLLPVSVRKIPSYLVKKVKTSAPDWFVGGYVKTAKKEKKVPLSAFAAMIAVAISLMLIVASSVMLTRAESRINALTLEADELSGEIAELRSDVDVDSDLLHLREIAVEEYGMVDEAYVKMTYLNTEHEDVIESYEEEGRGGIGLSALLSAIGIKD